MLTQTLNRLRQRQTSYGLAVLGGILYALGFCGYDLWYLAWLALIPTLWALDDPTLGAGETVALAWTTGLVAHLGVYTWLVGMLHTFGFLPWPLAGLGYFLLCLAQSSLFAAWGLMLHHLVRRGIALVWAAPATLVVAEWLYPAIFPSYLANSQYRQIVFIQTLDLWGPLGLTGLMALVAVTAYAWAAWRLRGRPQQPWAATALLGVGLAGCLLYGFARLSDLDDTIAHVEPTLTVGLIQTNMGIYEKSENPAEGLRRHRDQSLEAEAQGAQLIIWPESAYNYGIQDSVTNVKSTVLGPLRTPVLFGGLRVARPPTGRQIFNTAFLADQDGKLLGSYDKIYLLMFGEYLPLGEWLPFIYRLSPHTSHFNRGQHTPPLILGDIKLGTLICYEDILPNFVRRVMQQQPDVLVNLTNEAWFGKTREPLIHLALAAFRAVEQRRYLVRATNTGISAIIDPAGRIVAQSNIFTRANVVGAVAPLHETTLYQRFGDWLGYLCLGWILARLAGAKWRLHRSKAPKSPHRPLKS